MVFCDGLSRDGSACDVMRLGLRLLEEREARVKVLQEALIAGEPSTSAKAMDFEAFKAWKRAEYAKK
jgi:antitoxin ParD1/3/4